MCGLNKTMVGLLLFLLGASCTLGDVCHMSDPVQRQECSRVSLFYGQATEIRLSVLKQLCEAGHRHVLLKGAKPSSLQNLPSVLPRRAEQFAVFNIHRDDFSDKVTWKSGEAVDIMCDSNWFVDEEVKLTNGYHWYSHGLPLWPLVNQTLTAKKKGLLSRNKEIDWPNYGIATPFYLLPFEIYNSRDPALAIQKRFARDFAQSPLTDVQDSFTNANGLKDTVLSIYQTLFLDQTGYARKDISADFEAYPNWLQPLVKFSLKPMLESFVKSQGSPKRGQAAICPDELYIFFHQMPCSSNSTCLLLNEFQLILKLVNCPDTKIVVGYGENSGGIVNEEIISVKSMGGVQSMPGLQSMPGSQSMPGLQNVQGKQLDPFSDIIPNSQKMPEQKSKPNSTLSLKSSFYIIWFLFSLLFVRMI